MELLYWGHGRKEKIGTYIREHKHDFCQFEIIFCGTRSCQSENKLFKLHRGEIIFIPANVSHRFVDTSSDLEYFSFKFRVENPEKMPKKTFKLPHDFFVDWIFDDFRRLAQDDTYSRSPLHLRLITYLVNALYEHILQEKYSSNEPLLLSTMRKEVYRRGAEANMSEVAEDMNMSIPQLRREFKRIMKKYPPDAAHWETPSDFLKSELTKIASNHLLESNISIGEIAEMLWFTNIYTFSRYFKTNTGYSPSEYRKKFRKIDE